MGFIWWKLYVYGNFGIEKQNIFKFDKNHYEPRLKPEKLISWLVGSFFRSECCNNFHENCVRNSPVWS